MYLDFILLWPYDGCFTDETYRLEVQLHCFDKFVDNICCNSRR